MREERISVRYFPSHHERDDYQGHSFLLARDIAELMPYRLSRAGSSLKVELEGGGEGSEAWLKELLDVGSHRPQSLADTLAEFIRTVGNYIAYHGEVVFELAQIEEGRPQELLSLPPGRVHVTPLGMVQVIPKPDREELERGRWVRIPLDRCWRFAMPEALGGARGHRRLLRRLADTWATMPEFAKERLDFGASEGFEFAAYRDAVERYDERQTRNWGSVSSLQGPPGPSSEYFFFSRRLAFHRAQAVLREEILSDLNARLSRLPEPLALSVSGLQTSADLEEGIERLQRGDIGFGEVLVLLGGGEQP